MNVYEKLLAARLEFHQQEIKKSGWNDYSSYHYFELADFVVPILKLCEKHKLFTQVSFTKELATLTVIDTEKPDDTIVFTSPMAGAALKATHEIQQVGAVETYQRRYLYVLMMDIIEHDAIDASKGADPYTLMDRATTFKDLQEVFGAAYSAAKGKKKEQAELKAHYDGCKEKFAAAKSAEEPAGEAAQ